VNSRVQLLLGIVLNRRIGRDVGLHSHWHHWNALRSHHWVSHWLHVLHVLHVLHGNVWLRYSNHLRSWVVLRNLRSRHLRSLLLWSVNLYGDLVALSLAGLVGIASCSAFSGPVASASWVKSGIADHDSEVSHSDGLKNEEKEADQVAPERAVITIDDHKDNSDQSEYVEDERIYKVGNEESSSSLAGANDTHNREENAENSNNKRAKAEKSEHSE